MNNQRIKLLESYITEEPENPFNKYALAMEYYDVDPEKAATLLVRLSKEHPDYLPTYYKTANLLWELDRNDEAEPFFRAGIELAKQQQNQKALDELNASFLNFQFDQD